jgi:hypothetical protein
VRPAQRWVSNLNKLSMIRPATAARREAGLRILDPARWRTAYTANGTSVSVRAMKLQTLLLSFMLCAPLSLT